ncbi:MAG TPA: hypothetical protein VFK57_08440 [Vicinamibacterales bacterium]|nr:hypothetical protein [Vicinamibacterales bacterium]
MLYIVFSALGVCAALMLGLGIGIAGSVVGTSASPEDAAVALPIIGVAGTALVVFLLAISLPGLITGIGLLKYQPWARIAGIVIAAINLINIPFGTALGIYGLWVLLNKETEPLFAGTPTAISNP